MMLSVGESKHGRAANPIAPAPGNREMMGFTDYSVYDLGLSEGILIDLAR